MLSETWAAAKYANFNFPTEVIISYSAVQYFMKSYENTKYVAQLKQSSFVSHPVSTGCCSSMSTSSCT